MMMQATTCDGEPINPETFFAQQIMGGSPAAVIKAVANGQVDVGATWTDPPDEGTGAWNKYFGGIYGDKIKAIWYSDPIPNDTVAVNEFSAQAAAAGDAGPVASSQTSIETSRGSPLCSAHTRSAAWSTMQAPVAEPMAIAWCAEHGGDRCDELAPKRRGDGLEDPDCRGAYNVAVR